MRQLFPVPVDPVDPADVYRVPPASAGRPWLRLNMVASVDGATSLGGRTGRLGGGPDRDLFHLLRSMADVVLVGASTARIERYGPAHLTPELRDQRRARGGEATPPIAVVTRSCAFEWDAPFFTDAAARPIVVTVHDAPAHRVAAAREVADVVVAGHGRVDLAAALGALGERGARSVVCEGGPSLNAGLAAAGLIDELALTLSPLLAGGGAKRVLDGDALPAPLEVDPCSVCEEEGYLFLRFRSRRR